MKKLQNFQPKTKHCLLLTFCAAIVTAMIIFVPMIVYRGGVLYYMGDFNVQEIPFYQLVHDAVRSGQMGWHHLTDLGSDLLSSYSFYLLGSPFFWMTIPFPNEFVPYLIGPLMILKFGCTALSAHVYLKRYVSNPLFGTLGGLLYAFSGFSIYDFFFFHFHEPMIIFPLMLAALDAFIYDNRRGVFALAVFSACAINYYFFTGQAVFAVMYFLMLTLTKTYRFRLKNFLLLALEAVLGVMGAAFILLPSVLGILGNPRLSVLPQNWDALVYSKPQRYWLAILAFLFPPDMPAMPVFTTDTDCNWASVAGWLPLIGMTGVIAFMQNRKRDWLKKLITLLIFFALVPALNSVFQMLNCSIYYARWYYMLVLMLTLATLRALEDTETDWKRATVWSACLTAGAAVLIGCMRKVEEFDDGSEVQSIGVAEDRIRFWLYVLMAMACILGFVLIYKKFSPKPAQLAAAVACGALVAAIITSWYITGYCHLSSNTTEKIRHDILNARDNIEIDDLEEVRSDFYEAIDNAPMFWKIPSITCFHSCVSPSIMQFYDALGITRDVVSRPDYDAYPLRALLSCKYVFDNLADSNNPNSDECFITLENETKMPYWHYLKTCNNYAIYENECYIPMGFSYREFITTEELESLPKSKRCEAMLRYMVLDRETMRENADITGYTEEEYELLYSTPANFKSKTENMPSGRISYKQLCDERKKTCCDSFEYTSTGFRASYNNTAGENLVFFSVPYSTGWEAEVNGESVDVQKANVGFMAVRVPADSTSEIVFTYHTPGWSEGCLISLSALAVLAVYMGIVIAYRAKAKKTGR